MQQYIVIDGEEYKGISIIAPIKRNFQVLDGANAGRLALSGVMQRDIIGTFYNYSVTINSKNASIEEYDRFYETISSPQDFHTIQIPYGQDSYVFEAYVASGSDELVNIYDTYNKWGNLRINFIAKEPKRIPS